MTGWQPRPPELTGWAAIGALVGLWDLVVIRRRPYRSLSRQVWDVLDRPVAGPSAAGAMAFVMWHLLHKPSSRACLTCLSDD